MYPNVEGTKHDVKNTSKFIHSTIQPRPVSRSEGNDHDDDDGDDDDDDEVWGRTVGGDGGVGGLASS